MHAAAILAGLLAYKDAATPLASVAREMGRLAVFNAPGSWTLVLWDDLEARLTLSSDPPQPRAGDAIDAGATGLFALQEAPGGGLSPRTVRHQGVPLERAVGFVRVTIEWDGKEFKVERGAGSIAAGAVVEASAG